MMGNSARMFRRGPFLSEDQVDQEPLLDAPLNPKSSLYYGQGMRMGSRKPHSNILEQRLHWYLRTEEQEKAGGTHASAKTSGSMDEVQQSHLESRESNSAHPLELKGTKAFFSRNKRVFITEQH